MAQSVARTMPGTLELLPLEQVGFQCMLDTIRRNFERFGFLPIETPAIEYSDILLTKTGGETERQVYFVQSTGALGKHKDPPEFALRFDLTVPLARYVAEHERDLAFPFRRYQIQRVYRGERAQRGRFREFYQCDIDVIGKDDLSLRYDAEIPAVIHAVFSDLAFGAFTIQMNHRKLMRGYFEGLGIGDGEGQTAVLREVDKLDKRGAEHVRGELTATLGLPGEVADAILAFVQVCSTSLADALAKLDGLGAGSATFEQGRAELKEVLQLVHAFGVPESAFALNLSIARGLDYYTGMVYETTFDAHPQIGSICSGGRYDNLASQYTKSQLPGVGISIGATRLYWQLREAGLLPQGRDSTVQALVTQMDAAQLPAYLALASELRGAGIATEVALEGGKLGKQFKYADRAGIRFVLVLGEAELANGTVTVKDLRRNEQSEVRRAELVERMRGAMADGADGGAHA